MEERGDQYHKPPAQAEQPSSHEGRIVDADLMKPKLEDDDSDGDYETFFTAVHHPLPGSIIDEKFVVVGLLKLDNHAAILSVRQLGSISPASESGLEARVYNLRNLQPKYKMYRLRSMKRISKRAVLVTTWHEYEVVVYRTGDNKQRDDATSAKESKSNAKTSYQRESARLRQRDRRQARRQERRSLNEDNNDPPRPQSQEHTEPSDDVFKDDDVDERTYSTLVLLHLAYNKRPQLRKLLPESRG